MKKLLLFISIFAGIFSTAQTAAKWENIYGQGGNEYGYRVRTCLDQGYIVAGSTSSNGRDKYERGSRIHCRLVRKCFPILLQFARLKKSRRKSK